MRKLIAIILSTALLLVGCGSSINGSTDYSTTETVSKSEVTDDLEELTSTEGNIDDEELVDSSDTQSEMTINDPENLTFTGLDDAELLNYIEGSVYSDLVDKLDCDEYFVENVDATYVSEEYIEDLKYNSQSNVYFGYTLEELNEQFQGTRYIFTVDDNGKTVVQEMDTLYDNSAQEILENVAIGGGVILICVTVSVVTGGVAPAVSMIFMAGAKTGTVFALSSGAISGAAAAITTGYQTSDMEQAFEAGTLAASEAFKWGAITGALVGGGEEAIALHGATLNGLTMNQAATIQKESGYPLDVIKQFKSEEEYNVYKEAGLRAAQVGKKSALIRDIDLNYKTTFPDGNTYTNLEAMQKGYAPKYFDAIKNKELSYNLHHINQDPNGTLAILKETEHQVNTGTLHVPGKRSQIDRKAFGKESRQFWMDLAQQVGY